MGEGPGTFQNMSYFRPGKLRKVLLLALGLLLANPLLAADAEDIADLSLDQLMHRDVVRASTIAQQISDSPSAVAIVTAADIRAYGYRTLADVINSMRGLYTTYDRRYQYMGGRAFGAADDYAGRIMLLIDGYATQDNLFNAAYIEDSGLVDLELVERVEYVPGTGSVTYGNNALLGIINIVTKRGGDFNSTQLSTEVGSHGMRKQRITFGKRLENGADLLLSASLLDVAGQDIYFPAYDNPATNNGWARNIDDESSKRVFAKLSFEGLTLEGAYVDRGKTLPTNPSNATVFNAPFEIADRNAFLNARYETDLGLKLSSASRIYFGNYAYRSSREFTPDENGIYDAYGRYGQRNFDGSWWGLEQKFVGHWIADHTLVFGFEYRSDFSQNFEWRYSQGAAQNASESRNRRTSSFFLTDEYRINDEWSLNIGARYDNASDLAANWSPRLAAIYRPGLTTTIKASYSEAFRMPHAYERIDYVAPAPEYVDAFELAVQHDFSPRTRLTSSLYRYNRSGQMVCGVGAPCAPTGSSHSSGLEFELENSWQSGVRARGSVAFQNSIGLDGQDAINSPDLLGKFNLTFPILADTVRTGFELQYLGPRLTFERRQVSGTTLANLTFSSERKWHGLSASLSIRNLFDNPYDAVSPFGWRPASGISQDTLQMDGRTFWLQLNYDI